MAVVRRPDQADLARISQRFEHGQVLAPADEIVNLVDIDVATEESQRVLDLLATRRGGTRPDLRRDDGFASPTGERCAEHALGLAVHRRAVEEARSHRQGHVDDCPFAPGPFGTTHIEGAPGPHPYRGHIQPRLAERPILHGGERRDATGLSRRRHVIAAPE